jgi:hypothetical protein
MAFVVVKHASGSYRWAVENDSARPIERHLLGCKTRKHATALAAFANQPEAASYAALHAVAGADASVFAAFRLGVGPTRCNADPKTGEPLSIQSRTDDY